MEAGSSPLTRGKRRLRGRRICRVGLIPAHAGKTTRTPPQAMRTAAHPRSRGENENCSVLAVLTPGSSPLTRGKQPVRLDQVAPQRLIPAHAGKTFKHCGVPSGLRAHPRSRGENRMGRTTSQGACGSSPLTRGKRAISGCVARMVLAHPRSRGENCQRSGWSFRSSGSSPLTRGKLQGGDPVRLLTRLIPAHARKTLTPGSCPSDTSAHPRSRGENRPGGKPQLSTQGSSPLTRGKRSHHGGYDKRRGLIPAHAGKT